MTKNLWKIFLNQNFCSENLVGNRPCDNGQICDKCQANWASEAFKKFKNEKLNKVTEWC